MKDYYQILEVEPDASQEQIKSQYRFLVQGFHPDKYASAESKIKAEEKLKQINEAFSVLKDPRKREQYDKERLYAQKIYDDQTQNERERKQREAKEKAERERAKRAEEEQAARAKFQRETEEKSKSSSASVKQPPISHRKPVIGTTTAKSLPFPLWQVAALIVLGCFVLFLGWLGVRVLSPSPSIISTATKTVLVMPLVTAEIVITTPSATIEPPTIATVTPLVTTEFPVAITETYLITKESKMILIPAGIFSMGRINSAQDEIPVHEVYLNDYYIDETEITNAMYSKCVNSGNCTPPTRKDSPSSSFYFGNPKFDSYPVIYVSWNMANTFCQWRGDRLPTEAEWEKAARGSDGRIYPWGSIFNGNFLNFCDVNCPLQSASTNYNDGYADTAPVGSFVLGKSPYGLLDMAGNVYEWVADWYSNSYYAMSPNENPMGPVSGDGRVLRGGAWSDGGGTSSTSRVYFSPSSAYEFSGFRCASSP